VFFLAAWIPQYSPSVVWFARLFVLAIPVTSLLQVGRAALESQSDFTVSNKLLIASPAFTLLSLVTLWRTGTLNPVSGRSPTWSPDFLQSCGC
jgi:hypothetical protein